MKSLLIASAAALTLAACQTTSPLQTAVSGKTLVGERNSITVNEDGTLVGNGFRGTWEVRGDRWCRTITQPAQMAGTACQNVVLDGDQITFIRASGTEITFTIQ